MALPCLGRPSTGTTRLVLCRQKYRYMSLVPVGQGGGGGGGTGAIKILKIKRRFSLRKGNYSVMSNTLAYTRCGVGQIWNM